MKRTYRDDPRWLAARARYVADLAPGETDGQALLRRLSAALEMGRIESGTTLGGDAA